MIRRYIVALVAVILCFVFQTTLFQTLALADISPNLLVILTAAIGFMRGKKEGLIVGALSGALIDLFFCDVFGINAIVYMYVGYINGVFKKNFFPEDIRLPLVLIGASDMMYGVAIYILRFFARYKFDFMYYFLNIIMPEVVYTVLVSLIMYKIILFVNSKLDKLDKRNSKRYV